MLSVAFGPYDGTVEHHRTVAQRSAGLSAVALGAAGVFYYQGYTGTAIVAAAVALGVFAEVMVWDSCPIRQKPSKAIRKVLWESKIRNVASAFVLAYGWLQFSIAYASPDVCDIAKKGRADLRSRAITTILGIWTIDKNNCSLDESKRAQFGAALQFACLVANWLFERPASDNLSVAAEYTAAISLAASFGVSYLATTAFRNSVEAGQSSGVEHTYRLISLGAVGLAYSALLFRRICEYEDDDEEPAAVPNVRLPARGRNAPQTERKD